MTIRTLYRALALAAMNASVLVAAAPLALVAQAEDPLTGSFRPYLFVLLAYAAVLLLIAAWAVKIGLKLGRLEKRIDQGQRGD